MPNLLANDELVSHIAGAVRCATTLDDTQPWIRLTEPDVVEIHADFGPEQRLADPSGRARYLSVGAVLLNVRLAVRCSGLNPFVLASPTPAQSPTLVASLQVLPGWPASLHERELFAAIGTRPHWSLHHGRPLTEALRVRIERAAAAEHATLRLLSGLEAAQLRSVIAAEQRELAGHGPASRTRGSHSVLGVLATATDGPAPWLQAGQALQRVLLTAVRCHLDAAPRYEPIAVDDMLGEASWWNWPDMPQAFIEIGRGSLRLTPPRLNRASAPVPA